jgi:acyl-CoA thioesterase
MANPHRDPLAAFPPGFFDNDYCAQAFGIKVTEIAPGRATAVMTVRKDMLNGHGTCHGGMIFTLADTAFAIASNSRGDAAVAQFCSIAYMQPAALGDELTAVATESVLAGPRGVYDIIVTRGDLVIAAFRGHARTIERRVPANDDVR